MTLSALFSVHMFVFVYMCLCIDFCVSVVCVYVFVHLLVCIFIFIYIFAPLCLYLCNFVCSSDRVYKIYFDIKSLFVLILYSCFLYKNILLFNFCYIVIYVSLYIQL